MTTRRLQLPINKRREERLEMGEGGRARASIICDANKWKYKAPKNHGVEKITLSGIYLQKGRTKGCGEREGEGAPPADVPVLQNKQRLKMRNDTQTLPLVA